MFIFFLCVCAAGVYPKNRYYGVSAVYTRIHGGYIILNVFYQAKAIPKSASMEKQLTTSNHLGEEEKKTTT